MSALYAASFPDGRPWTAAEFDALLSKPATFLVTAEQTGFAIGQIVVDEVELITLAVAPEARRKGLGRAMLVDYEHHARNRGATRGFLEVAADNAPALALYRAGGWRESGRRRGYYKRPNGLVSDAILFEKPLT
ncbi:MAG: ribosomal protein S18-alanine N-acetyltransferase [Rhodobacteraceae bacterium]|nr:ribosomal protein S18-alanine N-acetyltransferase [Paracoccaceae bacterium]